MVAAFGSLGVILYATYFLFNLFILNFILNFNNESIFQVNFLAIKIIWVWQASFLLESL
jgi:hypothetical protein